MNKLSQKGLLAILSPLVLSFSFGLSYMLVTKQFFQLSLWIYVFTYSFIGVMGNIWVASKNPDLMNRRGTIKEGVQSFDRNLMILFMLIYCFVLPVVAGVDFNNGQQLPLESFAIALIIFVLGSILALSAILVNPYFESLVRIQTDCNHRVVDIGIYKIIRHPGYTAMLLSSLAHPILLRSKLSFIMALMLVILVFVRTANEDKFLKNNLEGYLAYSEKVKDKLIPYIW